MRCPACDVTLVVTDRQGVQIDHCPRCRGVWLDRGELDKLVERAAAGRSEHDHHDEDDGDRALPGRGTGHRVGDRGRHRRGFLDDLFDLD
jgi:Zn-finger nucleic acid-binding protein